MSQKFLNLVKTHNFFYEFLKLALLRARLSTQENGTSDVISGHCKRRSSDSSCFLCGIKPIKDWAFVERTFS